MLTGRAPLTEAERALYAPADVITRDRRGDPLPRRMVETIQEMRAEINRDRAVNGARDGKSRTERLLAWLLGRAGIEIAGRAAGQED